MQNRPDSPAVLTFDPTALARCYLVADILDEVYAQPLVEYGMVGLADRSRPLHVVETPLLPGQEVSESTVDQSGVAVLELRREIHALSRRSGRSLVPLTFIHRHPRGCQPSKTDHEFLTGVFLDQISTTQSFQEQVSGEPEEYFCRKCSLSMPSRPRRLLGLSESIVQLSYALSFSLIVNKAREYSLTAVRRNYCPACKEGSLSYVPAELALSTTDSLTNREIEAIRNSLLAEIESKIQFCSEHAP